MIENRNAEVLVAALKILGGVAHLAELRSQCAALGVSTSLFWLRNTLQSHCSDPKAAKATAGYIGPDLFYRLDAEGKQKELWGLRGFSVTEPSAYPLVALDRAYKITLSRSETPLGNVKGIAFRENRVHAIQVSFALNAPYPDSLLSNGTIEHIGEGYGELQTPTAGNRGMLEAISAQYEIPVFQSLGPKGSKRYVELGLYRVVASSRRTFRFSNQPHDTDAFIFTLEPSTFAPALVASDLALSRLVDRERGGSEIPLLRTIAKRLPAPSASGVGAPDPEAQRQALERRIKAHFELVIAFESRANAKGLDCFCNQYADVLCDGNIFEMKSLQFDEVAQVRAAIGQLYHYLFLHRTIAGYERANLFAVFDRRISPDLEAFLVSKVNIGVIWIESGHFKSDPRTTAKLPWLSN